MRDLDVLRRLGDQLAPPPLDLLRVEARRRQRRAGTLAVVSVVATVVVAGAVGLRLHADPGPTPATPVDDVRPLSYADGSVVHLGDQALSVPGVAEELDLTDAGGVVRTHDGRIWAADGSTLQLVGTLGEPGETYRRAQPDSGTSWVVTENRGPLAAWFEFPRPGTPVLVVYDTTAQEVVVDRVPVRAAADAARPVAVDGSAVLWSSARDADVLGRFDLRTSEQTEVGRADLVAAPAGAARALADGQDAVTDGAGARLRLAGNRLEPADDLRVWDGSAFEPWGYTAPAGAAPGQSWFLVQWVDDDTVVLQQPSDQRVELYTCSTSRQSCDLEKTVPPYVVLPGT